MDSIKTVNIKIEGKEWQDALEKAFEKANEKAKIDGFRPGKAPKDVFLKKYGEESLYMDAADLCLDSAYTKVFEQNGDIEVVAQPEIALKNIDKDGLELEFKLFLKPEIILGDYKKLKTKKEAVKVTDEEITKALDEMRNKYAENVLKEGKIEQGDIAIIDFEGFKDNVPFEGGKSENYSLKIGSNTFIPGFEEQLIGMSANEEKEINLTFPEDYHSEDLKGAAVVFKVKVNEIKEIKIPELNDEFFEDLGMEGISDKENLLKELGETIKARKEMQVENEFVDKLLEELIESSKIELHDVMIEDELHRMVHQYEDNLKMQGFSLEQFYQFTNSNEEQLKEQMKPESIRRLKSRLILEEIIKLEKIDFTDEDADKEAETMASKYQMTKEEFISAFGGLDMIKYDLKMRQALNILKGEN
ncbi:MAG: trigger factor [Bacilli bacterium]|nr:trigger factor [Bacilli bacterium]MDD4733775.1 trigger factor [Bacilli bacterium]